MARSVVETIDYERNRKTLNVYIHKKRYELTRKFLKQRLGDDSYLLDIGCGLGWGANLLASVSDNVIGIDISDDYLVVAKSRYLLPTFVRADALSLPFKLHCIDAVVLMEVIEHLRDHRKAISEILSILKEKGSSLVVSTPNKDNLTSKLAKIIRIVRKNPYHIKEFGYNELVEFLRSFRLKIINLCGIYLPPIIPKNRYLVQFLCYSRFYEFFFFLGFRIPSLARLNIVFCDCTHE